MQLDKETLVKHQFWFLLGLFVPLPFVAYIFLYTGVSAAVKKTTKEVKEAAGRFGTYKSDKPRGKPWLDALEKKDGAIGDKKEKIWEARWEAQKDIFDWPARVQDVMKDKYFPESLDKEKETVLQVYPRREVYLKYVEEIRKVVQPLNNKGGVLVQFNEDWTDMIRHIKDEWQILPATSPDVWLAQEDLWVQRELLRIIRTVNDSVAIMKPAQSASKPEKGEVDRKTFVNPNWHLELVLARGKQGLVLRGTITNVSSRRQTLGVIFDVMLKGSPKAEELSLEGEPLAPGKSFAFKESPVKSFAAQGIKSVEQVLDWQNAPVRRIDKLLMGQHSSRTALWGDLYPAYEKKAVVVDDEEKPPPGVLLPQDDRRGAGATPNGFQIYRYVDQIIDGATVRRMPVAMLLIVEQAHMADVLMAFADSKLRIQTTQWQWQHFRDDITPPGEDRAGLDDSDEMAPEMRETMKQLRKMLGGANLRSLKMMTPASNYSRRGAGPGSGGGKLGKSGINPSTPFRMRGPSSMMADQNPFMPRDSGSAFMNVRGGSEFALGAVEQQPGGAGDLVEMAVYGIASLYNRYPPKKTGEAGDAAPGK